MSYSSMAVRHFTSPKPLSDTMESARYPSLEPKITPTSVDAGEQENDTPVVGPKTGLTFSHQDALPKLPIPSLEDTCKRYLESLSALQTPREQIESKAAVQDFLKSDGPVLQEKLKNYATSKTSYIEQFCK